MGALWSSCTMTVSPFLRTNLVYLTSGIGMLTLPAAASAAGFALGAAVCCALRRREPGLTIINVRSRPAILLINLVLKVPPCEKSDLFGRRQKSWPTRNRVSIDEKGLSRSFLPAFSQYAFGRRMQQGVFRCLGDCVHDI